MLLKSPCPLIIDELISSHSSPEHIRLATQHEAFVALCHNRIVHAPLPSSLPGATLVDIGCGTGVVTRHLARTFPSASTVYGVDLSTVPAKPEDETLQNLNFVKGDFREMAKARSPEMDDGQGAAENSGRVNTNQLFQPSSLDFAYSRLLLCGIRDWPGYVSDVYRTLKPGCWAEMGDYIEDVYYTSDLPSASTGCPLTQNIPSSVIESLLPQTQQSQKRIPNEEWEWLRLIRVGGIQQGLDLDAGLNIPRYMLEAGFVDVQTWWYIIPFWMGAAEQWPETRKVIELSIGDKYGLYWHMLPRLYEGLNLSPEKIDELQMQSQKDLQEEVGKVQLFTVTIGRKPRDGEESK
jgi:SAM-dependent methyltransferase